MEAPPRAGAEWCGRATTAGPVPSQMPSHACWRSCGAHAGAIGAPKPEGWGVGAGWTLYPINTASAGPAPPQLSSEGGGS